jgi:hypothetical protein
MVDDASRVRPLSNGDLERLKEVAVAERVGVLKSADRRGYSRLIEARYVTARPVGTSAFLYVITDRGRRALDDAMT